MHNKRRQRSLKFTADFKSDVTWPEIQVILSKKLVRCQFHNVFSNKVQTIMKSPRLRITMFVFSSTIGQVFFRIWKYLGFVLRRTFLFYKFYNFTSFFQALKYGITATLYYDISTSSLLQFDKFFSSTFSCLEKKENKTIKNKMPVNLASCWARLRKLSTLLSKTCNITQYWVSSRSINV